MKTKFFIGFMLLFFLTACLAMETIEVREKTYGKGIPAISRSFASPQIRPGETWKVYLNASDPDGDMKYIIATIEQPGGGNEPPGYTGIAEGNRKDLSGYVYLNTAGVDGLNFGTLTLFVQIQDRAGHVSPPVSFPLSFNYSSKQEGPPGGVFQERDLGPVMVRLRPFFPDGDEQSASWE